MASSHAVLASPHEVPAGPGQREHWADNLRVLIIAVVVVWHTAMAYLGGDIPYYYMDRTTSTLWSTVSAPASMIAAFALGPLFLVGGWFSARSLAHKGPGAFARTRLLRLGAPLIVFIFLINPLACYLGVLRQSRHPSLAHYLSVSAAVGPMWFVAALLAFSLAYALLRRLHPAPVARRWSGAQVMMAAALLIAVTAFVVWQQWPMGDTHMFLALRWDLWPQGAGLFALGVWAGEAGSWEGLTAWAPRLGWTALAATVLFVAVGVYEKMHGHLASALHGTSWVAMGGVVLYGIISVAFTVWFTALIRARWSGDGPLRARRAGVVCGICPAPGGAHRDHGGIRVAGAGARADVPGRGRGGGPSLLLGWLRGDAGPWHLQGPVTASGQASRRTGQTLCVAALATPTSDITIELQTVNPSTGRSLPRAHRARHQPGGE